MKEPTMVRERKKRIPVSAGNKLAAEERPGYRRRWVNEEPGRVQTFLAAGYEPVRDPSANVSQRQDSNLGDSVTRMHVGSGRTAVLMEIPEEFYQEDQAAKQARIDESEAGLTRQIGKTADAATGQYGDVAIR